MNRTEEDQKRIDAITRKIALYHFQTCPFCNRVRLAIHRLNLSIELRDVQNNKTYEEELLREGGKIQVPCLRIDEREKIQWIYESETIIQYLETNFGISTQ